MRPRTTCIAALALLAGACAEALDTAPAGSPMCRHDTCTETVCEGQRRECRTNADQRCDDCQDACAEIPADDANADCLQDCERACDSRSCYERWCDPSCARHSFAFELPSDTDPAVLESCLRKAEYDRACGEQAAFPDCERLSRVLRTDVALAWDCRVALPCGTDASACYDHLPPGTLGDESCFAIAAACEAECDPGWRTDLNAASRWWRHDVAAALRYCYAIPDCDDLLRCLEAWHRATLGG